MRHSFSRAIKIMTSAFANILPARNCIVVPVAALESTLAQAWDKPLPS